MYYLITKHSKKCSRHIHSQKKNGCTLLSLGAEEDSPTSNRLRRLPQCGLSSSCKQDTDKIHHYSHVTFKTIVGANATKQQSQSLRPQSNAYDFTYHYN